MSEHSRKDEDPPKRIRVAIVSTSIAPYAIPEGECLASRPEITTRHFFAREKEPGRKWQIPEVPFPNEITAGFVIRLKRSLVYLPLMLPIRL
jgi:hypothetical protein